MTMKTSLIITGDSKVAVKAVEDLKKSVEAAGASAGKAAPQARQLDTALGAVGASASTATQASGALVGALENSAQSAGRTAQASGALGTALSQTSKNAGVASSSAAVLTRALDETAVSAGRTGGALVAIGTAAGSTATSVHSAGFQLSDLSEKSKNLNTVSQSTTRNLGAQRAAWQNLGYQAQDAVVQLEMGTSAMRVITQQGPQAMGAIAMLGHAADGAKGKFASFASFVGGPWGALIGVGIAVVGTLAGKLLDTADASDDAKKSTIDFSSSLTAAESAMGMYTAAVDAAEKATRSLINTQALMIDNSRIITQNQIGTLEAQLAGIDRQIAEKAKSANNIWNNLPGFFGTGDLDRIQLGSLQKQRAELADNLATARQARANAQTALEERAATERADPKAKALGDIERERARLRERRQYTLANERGVPIIGGASLERLGSDDFDRQMFALEKREQALNERKTKANKPKKDNSAAKALREIQQLDDFSDRAEESLTRLSESFGGGPKDVDRAAQGVRQIDAILKDVNGRLEGGKNITDEQRKRFEGIKTTAEALGPIIQTSLIRPITDMLAQQDRQISLGALQVQGRQAEAEALELTYSLMDRVGAESEEQLATELAKRGVTADQVRELYGNLDVLREQTREMQKQAVIQQAFLGSVSDMRENVRLTLQDLRVEGPKAFGDFFKRSLDVADTLFSEVATEKLFGSIFRDLEDQLTGADKVSDAGEKMAKAVGAAADRIKVESDKSSGALEKFAGAVETATARINGTALPATAATGSLLPGQNGPDIEVTGLKTSIESGFKEGFESVFDDFKKGFKDLFGDIFGDKGLFSESLEKTLGRAAGNAMLGGSSASIVTGLLGINGSGTGGMLGGAVGGELGKSFLGFLGSSAGPIGAIAGGILGGVVGGLFKKTPYGTAAITGQGEDDISVRGNKSAAKANASSAAGAVQDGLAQIAEAFGGTVGGYRLSIGTYKDNWRVDTGGRTGKLNFKGNTSNLHDFGDDSAGAIVFAIADAVADGAIEGVSDRVAQALKSTSDIDEAIAEALKVREVEILLGGIGAELEQQFKTLESQAKERLRIAREYGFDVVEIEKKNAEDRARLVDQILTDRVGSLQSLLNDMKYGSLFEGSAMDQREALLTQIAAAQTAAEAGEEGAADTLASLSRQLVELSRDAFGTAGGEYASDRSTVMSASETVIQIENDRIKAAQDAAVATNSHLEAANKIAAAGNDLTADTNSLLQQLITQLSAKGVSVAGLDLSTMKRGSV